MTGRMESVETPAQSKPSSNAQRRGFPTLPTAPWKSLTRFPHSHSPDDDDFLLSTRGHFYWATEGDISIGR